MWIPDHPAIRRAERTGYYEEKEPEENYCPICGEACYRLYRQYGVIIGCDQCVEEEIL